MELHDGDVVNLGIGLPTLVPNYLPEGVEVILQTENGLIGMGPTPAPGEEDPDLINAGGGAITALPGAASQRDDTGEKNTGNGRSDGPADGSR